MTPVQIASIEAYCFRVPVKAPIKVAFGTFRHRPFVLVRITDSEGAQGWGEVWANWPAVGAEHRARLAIDIGERLVSVPPERRCEAAELLLRDRETGRRTVPTEKLEMLRAGGEAAVEVEVGDGASRPLPALTASRDEHDRAVKPLDEPRGDDPDDALVPALVPEDVSAPRPRL